MRRGPQRVSEWGKPHFEAKRDFKQIGPGGAGILALWGDLISDDDHLNKFLALFTTSTDGKRPYNTTA
jgi:hypothetical protein